MRVVRAARGLPILGATLLATAILLTTALLSAPAYAHTELVTSDPADGARLDSAPAEVTLTFSEPVNPELSKVSVTVDGKAADASPKVDGATVTVPLDGVSGSYQVVYRVVSGDGHPVEGTLRFTVAAAGADAAAPVASAPSTSAETDHHDHEHAAGATTTPQSGTVTRSWVWLVVGLGGLILLGALAYVLTIGRRRQQRHTTGGDGGQRDGSAGSGLDHEPGQRD